MPNINGSWSLNGVTNVLSVAPPPTTPNFIIPLSTEKRTINAASTTAYGTTSWSQLANPPGSKTQPQAGDIIQFEAGEHGQVVLTNFIGTDLKRYRFIPSSSGIVTFRMQNKSTATGGFIVNFVGCRYFDMDGRSNYVGANRNCGFFITYAKDAKTGDKDPGPSTFLKAGASSTTAAFTTDHFSWKYVEVDGGWNANSSLSLCTNGIGIQPAPGTTWTRTGNLSRRLDTVEIAYCYVHNTEGEGLYVGNNWNEAAVAGKDLSCHDNYVEHTGWDNIQCKSWQYGTNNVYNNTCYDSGLANDKEGQLCGISCIEGSYNQYGNFVVRAGSTAVQHYNSYVLTTEVAQFTSNIYNNVIVDNGNVSLGAGKPGIGVGKAGTAGLTGTFANVYNNTVIRASGKSITATAEPLLDPVLSTASSVRNNLCCDCGTNTPSISVGTSTNNRTGTVAAQNFVNAADNNFRLTATSPALDQCPTGYPPTDFDGNPRPYNVKADQGAFEYVI